MANAPQYDAAAARADKMLEPDGSIQTHSGTVVSGPSAAGAAAYSQASARADKLLQPDGSIVTSGSGSGGSTPPGGASGQVQYNNAGVFSGAAGVTTDGTNLTVTGSINPSSATTLGGTLTTGNINPNGNTGIGITSAPTNPLQVGIGANTYFQIIGPTGAFTNPIFVRPGGASAGPSVSANGASFALTASNGNSISLGIGSGQPVIAVNISNTAIANGFTFNASAIGAAPVMAVAGSDTNISLKLQSKGTGAVLCTGVVVTPVYTVATLPAAVAGIQGARALVTDATAPTFLGTLTGGGSVICPVFCNGSAWLAG